MEKKVEILAYHGWGADASFWDNMSAVIPDSIALKPANRGYFGKPFYSRFDPDTKFRVIFTHSYGLHWCNTAVLSKADVLVIFNGFGSFFPDDEPFKAITKKGLEGMIKGFNSDHTGILESFYKNCLKPSKLNTTIPPHSDEDVLLGDLKELRNTKFPLIDLDFGATMVALDGGEDKILLTPRGDNITKTHYGPRFVKVFENMGHALPLLNPENCWSYLCSIIPIFQHHENNR